MSFRFHPQLMTPSSVTPETPDKMGLMELTFLRMNGYNVHGDAGARTDAYTLRTYNDRIWTDLK